MARDLKSTGRVRLASSLFYSLLVLLLLLPMPWGGNAVWVKGLFCAWVFMLTAVWSALFIAGSVQPGKPLRKARPGLLLLVVVQLWVCLQLLPLPIEWLAALSPNTAAAYLALDRGLAAAPLTLDTSATRLSALMGWAYLCLFYLVLVLVNTRTRLKHLCALLVLSGLFQACYGSFMVLSGVEYSFFTPKEAHIGRATGTFLNRNHLANYLVMCVALGIGVLIATMSHRRGSSRRDVARQWLALLLSPKARLRLYLAIMVIGLVLTVSRMGNTSFFLSLAIAGAIAVLAGRRFNGKLLVLLASLIIVDLLIVGEWFGFDKVVERLESTHLQQEERTSANLYTLAMIGDFPLGGTGAGSFSSSFPRYRGAGIDFFYDHAHNDYLQFAAELGIPAALVLLAFCGLSLVTAIRAQFRRRDPWMQGMAFSATMAIVAMAIHGTVEFNLQIPANTATFMVLLALAWLSAYMPGETRREKT